jgi:hypothetical protein
MCTSEFEGHGREDVFEICRDFIRTVPVLQHDPIRPEDLDTRAEDHIADEARYACLSRPLIAPPPGGLWGAGRSIIGRWGRAGRRREPKARPLVLVVYTQPRPKRT